MGAASSSSEKFTRNDLVKKSVLGMMDPIAVAAASAAFGHDVVDAERLTGNVELGLFHLMVGPEHAEEAYRLWTCAPPRFGTESGVPMLTVRMREGTETEHTGIESIHKLCTWLVRSGGIYMNVFRANTFYIEGHEAAKGLNYQFIRGRSPNPSVLTYVRAGTDPSSVSREGIPVRGASLHEAITESMMEWGMYPPGEFVFAFVKDPNATHPAVYSIEQVEMILFEHFGTGRLREDLEDIFGANVDVSGHARDVMRLMRVKYESLDGDDLTADGIERCRREAYEEALTDTPKDKVDRVLSRRCFFDTYAAAMGYVRHTDRPSFEVQIIR